MQTFPFNILCQIIIGAAASILLWWRLPRTEDTIESRKRFVSKKHKKLLQLDLYKSKSALFHKKMIFSRVCVHQFRQFILLTIRTSIRLLNFPLELVFLL